MKRVNSSGFVSALCCFSILLFSIGGCSNDVPSGCPKDLPIPDDVETLGSSFDQDMFVLRLRTTEYKMDEIVELFRKRMKKNEWEVKTDSATDANGGELVFVKGENRLCEIFITHSSDSDQSINVNIKCDRANAN